MYSVVVHIYGICFSTNKFGYIFQYHFLWLINSSDVRIK